MAGITVIHGNGFGAVRDGEAASQWGRMHASLSAWKAHRLLIDAASELERLRQEVAPEHADNIRDLRDATTSAAVQIEALTRTLKG